MEPKNMEALFWAHYSYIGLIRRIYDKLIKNYFDLNKNQVLIDYKYCVENPKNGKVMDPYWGLTPVIQEMKMEAQDMMHIFRKMTVV
jgi:hypothetical protein